MPLSEHEQRILEEIEKRLQEEDPRLANAVSRTSLYGHAAGRIRWAALAFVAGFIMLMLFALSVLVAIAGFVVMLASTLLIYRQLRLMGQEQVREYSRGGRLSLTAFLARLSERFRGNRPNRG
jgi:Protein of unknown function (DUF3040)